MGTWVRLIAAVGSVIATVALGVQRLRWPSQEYWDVRPKRLVGAVVWLGLFAFWETFERAFFFKKAKAKAERDAKLKRAEKSLGAMLPLIVKSGNVPDFTLVGLHAFFVVRRWRLRKWPWHYEAQEHAVRIRIGDTSPSTDITYERGKGVIGRCWQSKKWERANLAQAFRNYRNATKDQWDALPADTRYGLSWEEFLKTRDEPLAIFAAPMVHEGRYLGCVTVDAPPDLFRQLDTRDVRRLVEMAAANVRDGMTS